MFRKSIYPFFSCFQYHRLMPNQTDLEHKIDTIGRHSCFGLNTRQELSTLASKAEWLTYKRGEMIFGQGDTPKVAHIVHSGRVKVFRLSSTGQAFISLIAGPFNTLNVVTCFGPNPRFFSAEALEDVRLLAIPANDFVDFVVRHPTTAKAVIVIMGKHQMSAINRVMDLIEEGVQQRILNVLTLLCNRFGSDLPLTNADLAELAGTTRETAARIVSRMGESGFLAKKRGRINILDPELLKKMASDRYFFF